MRIHLLDDRQYRDPQVCPPEGRGGSNTVPLKDCADFNDPDRSLLGPEQERWLADNWSLDRPWNLLAQQTLMARFTWSDPVKPKTLGGRYWTDGWDGYAPARNRLLSTVAAKAVPGVVVLGGDVHANYVADLVADFDKRGTPTIATEFCGTSITSLSVAQERVDAAKLFNPHIHHARADQRGYVCFKLDRHQLQATLKVVDDALDADSLMSTQASFVVLARQPGAHLA